MRHVLRVVFAIGLVASLQSPVLAQGIAASLHELRLLVRPGETVTVTQPDGRDVRGRIASLSGARIVLETSSGQQAWTEDDIARIRQRRADSLANGALIGLGVGAGIGLAGGLALRESGEDGLVFAVMAVYGGIGAGVGVGFDAIVRSEYVIFERATSPPVSLRFSPLVTAHARGVRLSLSF